MPIIQITYATPAPSAELPAAIAAEVAAITTRILHKKPELTAVVVREHQADHWFVAGPSLGEHGLASFFLDIKIVDGTNTKDEKAAYVAAIFEAFGKLLGPMHPESYVYVHDVRAEAYGFGGLTQEHRYVAGRLAAA